MAVDGIDLEINADGNVETIQPQKGELCSGLVVCPNCENNFCTVDEKHWADIKQCPIGKWLTLWHGEPSPPPHYYPKDACYVCGGKNFWKSALGDAICKDCHPPMKNAKCTNASQPRDMTFKKELKAPKKKPPGRSVKVIKKPGKQSKFFA